MNTVVTAALPYANGELHLGHVKSTYLPPDIYTRFLKFTGEKAIYLCATDEHGTPILFRSEEKGTAPEEYIKTWRKRHLQDLKFLLLDFDYFYATHSPEHIKLTQDIYGRLKKGGFIYKGIVKQYWCPKENKPLPDRYVVGSCPHCGAEEQYGDQCEKCGKALSGGELVGAKCKTCGADAEVREGEHVFFKLSAFSEKLRNFVKKVEAPKDIKNFVLGWIKEGLQDWDIERDISWGVPIPGSDGVFYVWFDAPIGYMSTLTKWCNENDESFDDWWSSRIVHFIGKDIAYHHFLFWPAILMGSGYAVPDSIPVRGHLTLEGKKFSKSRNWYVSIAQWRESGLDPEYLRFYMAYTTPLGTRDGDFSADEFKRTVNEELVNNFGNLLQRLLKFAERFDSKIPDAPLESQFDKVKASLPEYEVLMREGKLSKALHLVCSLSHGLNAYFQKKAPWKNESLAPGVIATTASSIKLINAMLYPFIPLKAEKVAGLLGIGMRWEDTPLKIGHPMEKAEVVFPKILSVENLQKIYR